MKCLLCHSDSPLTLSFYQLFLLLPQSPRLCSSCYSKFHFIKPPHCSRCFKAGIDGICSDCHFWEEEEGIIIKHQAVFTYNEAMEDYFSRYKFMGDYRLRKAFSHHFKKEKDYTLVPVPISEKRLQERGFNQVLGFIDHLHFAPLLEKEEGLSQHTLSRNKRLQNKNTFTLKAKVKLPKKVLLVDDVYTTGRTLQHAIAVLKEAGVQDVKSFSLCR